MKTKNDEIIDLFEKDLAKMYKSSPRHEQVQMAVDIHSYIDDCSSSGFKHNKVLFAEAPVGTGKSLGALIPGLMATKNSLGSYKGMVYATATIGLQSQLWYEEQETLIELGLLTKNEAVLAMGRNNTACQKQFIKNKKIFSLEEINLLESFFTNTVTGLKDELIKEFGFNISSTKWQKLQIPRGKDYPCECAGHKYRKNLKKNSRLTLTNQQQLLAAYTTTFSGSGFQPIINLENKIIVIDEAHELQSNFLEAQTKKFRFKDLKKISKTYLKNDKKAVFSNLESKFDAALQSVYSGRGTIIFDENIMADLKVISNSLKSIIQNKEIDSTHELYGTLNSVSDELDTLLIPNVYKSWYDFDVNSNVYDICYSPKNFGENFKIFLRRLSEKNPVILLSGTFTSNAGVKSALKVIQDNWYLKEQEFLHNGYSSIFDWKKQIYGAMVKKDYPPITIAERHIFNIVHQIEELSSVIDGGILVLTTSLEYKDKIGQRLVNKRDGINRKILIQKKGESQNPNTVSAFKTDGRAILVGSGSYYTGFSVPGNALQCVVLTRLPFPVQSDPLFTIKRDEIELSDQTKKTEAISNIRYFMMFIKLEQGIGRLIRDVKDYGVLYVTDPRAFTDTRISQWFKERDIKLNSNLDGVSDFLLSWRNDNVSTDENCYIRDDLILDSHKNRSQYFRLYSVN